METRNSGTARRRGAPGRVIAAGAVVALALSAAGYMVWATAKTPPSLAGPAPVAEAPVTAELIDDARDVRLVGVEGDSTRLGSPAAGRITALDCAPGQAWVAGESNLAVDGAALINLPTAVPLWRDLEPGAKGGDVDALRAALAGLGFGLEPTGRYDQATRKAVAELLGRHGLKTGDGGVLSAASFFWLPLGGATPGECALALGQAVEAGETVMTTLAGLAAARVEDLPGDLVEGARVAEVNGLTVPVDTAGAVADPAALAELTASGAARSAAAPEDAAPTWAAVLRLAEPVTVYPLAPSAIAMAQAPAGCVQAGDGTTLPVKVVASQMGRSFVVFADAPPPATVRAQVAEGLTCG
ncbi:MAG: peptidoglycan-binding protein [Bifidobacteriaceae bacterium]|jgi:peptidoglycan hydrolase-like protein with peptidoglycan-binding domain|nr:peptidoglycan-binding protein [Bifidobacteriaceae bacterium]